MKLFLFYAIWLALAGVGLAQSAKGFLDAGCQWNWKRHGAVLGTYCLDHVCDEVQWTEINLNWCIGNVDGVLTPQKK